MSKTRCKLSDKDYEKKKPEDPKYKCKKCGREAIKDEKLCKPQKLKKK